MQVTGVSIHHVPDRGASAGADHSAPLMFCSIVLDESLIVHEVRLIGSSVDQSHLAMPSRRLTYRCSCGIKVAYRSKFCSECGVRLDEHKLPHSSGGRATLHADVTHPIEQSLREEMLGHVRRVYLSKVQSP